MKNEKFPSTCNMDTQDALICINIAERICFPAFLIMQELWIYVAKTFLISLHVGMKNDFVACIIYISVLRSIIICDLPIEGNSFLFHFLQSRMEFF